MALPLHSPYPPMEALAVDSLPEGPEWQYEPKWDGFRCLAFRDGERVELQSKSGQPLARYFPELVDALSKLPATRFVLDGEIIVADALGHVSFDTLLQRIHPSPTRVNRLAAETPATLVVFDLLVDARGHRLTALPLADRRAALEEFATRAIGDAHRRVRLSPCTGDRKLALRWLAGTGVALDGVVAKRRDLPYASGTRDGMQKVKEQRTADCVVGGFRYAQRGGVVGSLLLGLYDGEGRLDHVGFTSGLTEAKRAEFTRLLEPLRSPPGFTGRAPGGPSRWSRGRSEEWEPVKPVIVVEVQFDQASEERFRHGTRLLRLRPDKAPRQCTLDQLARPGARSPLELATTSKPQRKGRDADG